MPSLAAHIGCDTVETLQSTAMSTAKGRTGCRAFERGDFLLRHCFKHMIWAAAATWHVSMTKQMHIGPASF